MWPAPLFMLTLMTGAIMLAIGLLQARQLPALRPERGAHRVHQRCGRPDHPGAAREIARARPRKGRQQGGAGLGPADATGRTSIRGSFAVGLDLRSSSSSPCKAPVSRAWGHGRRAGGGITPRAPVRMRTALALVTDVAGIPDSLPLPLAARTSRLIPALIVPAHRHWPSSVSSRDAGISQSYHEPRRDSTRRHRVTSSVRGPRTSRRRLFQGMPVRRIRSRLRLWCATQRRPLPCGQHHRRHHHRGRAPVVQ